MTKPNFEIRKIVSEYAEYLLDELAPLSTQVLFVQITSSISLILLIILLVKS